MATLEDLRAAVLPERPLAGGRSRRGAVDRGRASILPGSGCCGHGRRPSTPSSPATWRSCRVATLQLLASRGRRRRWPGRGEHRPDLHRGPDRRDRPRRRARCRGRPLGERRSRSARLGRQLPLACRFSTPAPGDAIAVERSAIGFLVNHRAELERQATLLETRLEQVALGGGGPEGLAAAIAGFLGRPIAIEGRGGATLAVHVPAGRAVGRDGRRRLPPPAALGCDPDRAADPRRSRGEQRSSRPPRRARPDRAGAGCDGPDRRPRGPRACPGRGARTGSRDRPARAVAGRRAAMGGHRRPPGTARCRWPRRGR